MDTIDQTIDHYIHYPLPGGFQQHENLFLEFLNLLSQEKHKIAIAFPELDTVDESEDVVA